MIYRKRPPILLGFDGLPRKRRLEHINEWLNKPKNERGDAPFITSPAKRIPEIMPWLRKHFDNKCVYCEVKFTRDDQAHLSFFRPPDNACQEEDGPADPHHYFWLVWEWSNLYLACTECVNRKRSKFPIAVGCTRAEPGVFDIKELNALEKPLLLDPCFDNPLAYLEFDENGSIEAKQGPGQERGIATIKTLYLKREGLCTARRKEAQELKELFQEAWQVTVEKKGNIEADAIKINNLESRCKDDQQFAGMKRQLLWGWLQKEKRSLDTPQQEILLVLEKWPWKDLIDQLDEWINVDPPPPSSTPLKRPKGQKERVKKEKVIPPPSPKKQFQHEKDVLLRRLEDLQKLLKTQYENLYELKIEEAKRGFDLPIRNQIKEYDQKINETEAEIVQIKEELIRLGYKF